MRVRAAGRTDGIVRPSPLQWLRYVFVGSVPARNRAWVLYDATCRTWILRHIARYLVLVAPIVIPVMIFLPAPLSLRIESCVTAVLTMMLFFMGFTVDSVERRVEKAGYPSGIAARMREQRAVAAQRDTAARNRDRRGGRVHRHGRA